MVYNYLQDNSKGDVNLNKLSEDLKNAFNFPIRATIYNNMEIAMKAYNMMLIDNDALFKFEKSTTAKGHLRTLFIEKQFSDSSFNPKASYAVRLKEVNKYHHKALFIETDDFLINIARTMKYPMLPSASAYKMEHAKNNRELNAQYELRLDDMDKIDNNIVLPKKYAFLTYGVQNEQLSHLGIVVPSHDYSGFVGCFNISKEETLLRSYVPEELKEEAVVSLKRNVLKKLNIK